VRADIPSITVLGVRVAALDRDRALAEIEQLHAGTRPARVAFANAHTVNLAYADATYRQLLNRVDLVLNDGSGLAIAARLQGSRFPTNLNGSDLSPRLLALARDRGWRVFFLGGAPGVADEAARRLTGTIPGLLVVGCADGFFEQDDEATVVATIERSGCDLLLVGMGNPVQERWLEHQLEASGARLGVAVGAFFDFAAERVPRSPELLRRVGIEWLYRLVLEPGRLWRRYVLGNPLFLWRVTIERVRHRSGPTPSL
jgi:exopolysaccharide biosynthesis WecB/TagA/CpsF family protein